MKAILKKIGTVFGYGLYFIGALALFVYLTLPIEEAKAYLIRLASDTYNADLEITDLSLNGISGVQAEGVVVTVRPSSEELSKIREAQALRQAWETRQAELKAREEEEKKAAKKTPKDESTSAKKAATSPSKTTAKDTKKKQKDAEKAPPVPSGPLPVSIDRLAVSIGFSDFVADLMDGKLFNEDAQVRVETSLLGGSLEANIVRNGEGFEFKASAQELNLTQMNSLARVAPVPVIGQLSLDVDLSLPINDKGRHQLTKVGGHIEIDIANAVFGPGKVESAKLKSLGGSVDVPKLTLSSFGGRLKFAKRRATFEKFKFSGKDVEGDISGYIQLAKTFNRFGPRSYLRFKFSDGFLRKNSAVKTILKNVPMVKRGTAADGFTGFTVTGRLSKPSWKPRKTNPYAPRKKTRRAKGKKKFKTKVGRSKSRTSKPANRYSNKKKPTSAKSLSSKKSLKSKSRPPYGNSTPPGYPSKPTTPYPPSKRKVIVPDDPEDEDEEEEDEEEEESDGEEEDDGKNGDESDNTEGQDLEKKEPVDDEEEE